MIASPRIRNTVIFVMLLTAGAHAQASGEKSPALPERPRPAASRASIQLNNFRPTVLLLNNRAPAGLSGRSTGAPQATTGRKQRSVQRKVLGAIVGATGGFFAGGYLGAAIDGECNCDDPGLKGAIIGAPIGAVAGGILGYNFLF
jgi:hypothetical protein